MAPPNEFAVGFNKGHKVTKLEKRVKPSHRKGVAGKRLKFVRDIIKEVTGQAYYEKRAIEYLKIGKDKKCVKFLKARLGTIRRAKRKRDELSKVLLQMKRQKEQHH
ncbi:60S ribosomal protein L36 [Thelohanellus kitauei]|uniref:Large ribosomal subunit protein eL36 n=1 Tax=Thelohanellus kitauei TaxID=669202 RepID=A0A0C2I872_THEKT|nr:60S ribosomal protein L36 [Thelohanellus kitauei]